MLIILLHCVTVSLNNSIVTDEDTTGHRIIAALFYTVLCRTIDDLHMLQCHSIAYHLTSNEQPWYNALSLQYFFTTGSITDTIIHWKLLRNTANTLVLHLTTHCISLIQNGCNFAYTEIILLHVSVHLYYYMAHPPPLGPHSNIRIFQASVVIFWIWTRTLNPFAIKTWLQSTPNCTVHRTQFGPTLVYIKWDQIRVFSRAHLGCTTYIPLLLPASQDGLDICSVCLHLRSLHGMWLVQHWVHYNCPPLTAGWLIL